MRRNAATPDLRPCSDGFATTRDGWRLGIRHIRPAVPDPGKLPVVLCHGLGLNATFWTITDNHLPEQLAARGYDVFLVDLRGSGESARLGRLGRINARLRETLLLEWGEGRWNVDEMSFYDVPAVLDYVKSQTGHEQVNWVGHSLGGMLLFPYLELDPAGRQRIANFVGMGSTVILAEAPQRDMLRANRGLRMLTSVVSTGRLGRPLMYFRFPGLDRIDQFYYTSANVDKRTIKRFYGYTLEDPGRSALKQLDPYLELGHFLSADRTTDYSALLGRVTTPTLLIAGETDCMSDIPSTRLTYDALGAPDKALMRFGRADGHVADYGHCDLVWSRYAPREIFPPVIDWLDRRQPGALASPQGPVESAVP
jgi:pimeloyl-ACP methyl ester carboxylesterase